MISYLQRRGKLRKSISAIALLAALPNAMVASAAMAQQVVVTENTSDGLSYSEIISFTNPGFNILGPGDGSGVEASSVSGDFSNSGFVSGDEFGVVVDHYIGGNFTNAGRIEGGEVGLLIEEYIGGDFTNSGNISGEGAGVDVGAVDGNFTNSGTIDGDEYAVVTSYVGGDFTNSGYINADSFGVTVFEGVDGNFTNSGAIDGGEHGVNVEHVDGDFTNSGDITSDYVAVYSYYGVAGNFTNSGTIDGDAYGVDFDYVGGDFTNSDAGVIGGGVYGVTAFYVGGDFTNAGRITSDEVAVLIGGVYEDDYYDELWYGGLDGNFTNSGVIGGGMAGVGALWVDGDFTNSGTITSDGEVAAIFIGGFYEEDDWSFGLFGNFTNSGLVAGGEAGFAAFSMEGDFTNTGTITADGYGVAIGRYFGDWFYSVEGLDGNFTNSGTINGDEFGVWAGYFAGDFTNSGNIISDGFAVLSYGGVEGDFTNSGTINSGYVGVGLGYVGGDFNNSGDIFSDTYGVGIIDAILGDFTNSGSIDGGEVAVDLSYVGGNFTNSGNITGGEYAVLLNEGLEGDFTNSGNITADENAVYFRGAIDSNLTQTFEGNFTNSGTIISTEGDYGVRVNDEFDGDFINTGYIISDGEMGTMIEHFSGNLTTPVNQGVATVEADIRDKTVTAYVDRFYTDGTEWYALYAEETFQSDGDSQSVADTSAMMDVYIAGLGEGVLMLGLSANDINEVASGEAGGLGLLGLAAGLIEEREHEEVLPLEERALLDSLYQQGSSTEVAQVLADYSPSGSRGSAAGSFVANQQLMDTLSLRLGSSSSGGGSANTATFGMANTNKGPSNGSSQWWVQGFGGVGDLTNDGVVGGYDLQTVGVGFGVEAETGDGMLVGAAFAVAGTNFDGSASSGDVVSYMPAIYGRFQANDWYLSGVASGSFNQIDQSRFNTTAGETLTADYSGGQANLRAEAGYDIKANGAALTPFLAGTFGYVKTDAYDEQGGTTALSVGSTSDTHFLVEAGSRLSATHGATTFNAVAGWREDFGTLDTTVSANLQNSASFTSTYDINVSGFFGGVGFTMMTAQDFAFEAGVSGIIGADYSSIDGQVGLKKKF